jgi:tRNA (guanine37-N1)-methyltransferase
MVMKPEPIFECAEALGIAPREKRGKKESVALLSPQGKLFSQAMAEELAQLERLVLICGRYEGVDERVSQHLADREISIGNYVLSGGEMAAAIVIDAVTRLLPGALGNERSAQQESFSVAELARNDSSPDSTCAPGGLLDYPHYTRPADFRGLRVPEELISGNHEQIREWRRRQALEKTLRNRPELLEEARLSEREREWLARSKH